MVFSIYTSGNSGRRVRGTPEKKTMLDLVLLGATLLTGDREDPVISDGFVAIDGNRIAGIGRRGELPQGYAAAQTIELPGTPRLSRLCERPHPCGAFPDARHSDRHGLCPRLYARRSQSLERDAIWSNHLAVPRPDQPQFNRARASSEEAETGESSAATIPPQGVAQPIRPGNFINKSTNASRMQCINLWLGRPSAPSSRSILARRTTTRRHGLVHGGHTGRA